MPLALRDLVIEVAQNAPDGLLDEWTWLIGDGCTPVLLTAAGDVFLQKPAGGVWLLNVMEATLQPVADSVDAFRGLLPSQLGAWALPKLILELQAQGKLLQSGQCYSLKRPLFLGGELHPDNVDPCDISVHLSIAGQLAQQTRGLASGTPVTVSGPRKWISALTRRITMR